MTGLEHVNQMFANRRGRAMFMPYFAVGYPDLATSIDILEGLARAGADAIEVGVPFSDPLADGPVIQHASNIALKNGVTLPICLEAIRTLRKRGVTIPLILMSYVNPIFSYAGGDLEKFMLDSTAAGVSGFIIPDLPPDEADDFQAVIDAHHFGFAHFLAPTSDDKRIELVAQKARGFIYLVSVTGVTGARQEETVSDELRAFIQRVRQTTKQPLVVGFGISSPEKAYAVGQLADGVIIGSKLIELAGENPQQALDLVHAVVARLKG